MKILLVEDDACLAEALSEAIADQLYVVKIASDGEAAWKQFRSTKYDLILLDFMLPKLNGIQLCHRCSQLI